jgi:plasmid replication initiation protein
MSVDVPSDRQRDLTVAHVRERMETDFVDVMFLESARFFRLSRSHRHFDRLLAVLKTSEAAGRTVRVTLTVRHGDDIEDVQTL